MDLKKAATYITTSYRKLRDDQEQVEFVKENPSPVRLIEYGDNIVFRLGKSGKKGVAILQSVILQ